MTNKLQKKIILVMHKPGNAITGIIQPEKKIQQIFFSIKWKQKVYSSMKIKRPTIHLNGLTKYNIIDIYTQIINEICLPSAQELII
jgi:hypothetical protein